jgi:hypothetical protein
VTDFFLFLEATYGVYYNEPNELIDNIGFVMYYFTYFSTDGALVQPAWLYYLSLMFNRDDIKDGARNF